MISNHKERTEICVIHTYTITEERGKKRCAPVHQLKEQSRRLNLIHNCVHCNARYFQTPVSLYFA